MKSSTPVLLVVLAAVSGCSPKKSCVEQQAASISERLNHGLDRLCEKSDAVLDVIDTIEVPDCVDPDAGLADLEQLGKLFAGESSSSAEGGASPQSIIPNLRFED